MNLSFLSHLVRLTAEEILAGGTISSSDADIELRVTDTGDIVLLLPSSTVPDGYRAAAIDFKRVDPATREPELRRLLEAD